MADYLNIAGRVRTTASDGVAMEAQEVKDLNLNKSQQEVNADVQTELGDRYTKEETYSKEQLNELITTPDVNYVSVVATDATTAVTDILPATGEANTIYRVGNWDGTQYDPTMYALYAWNGSAYVCLAVRSFVGEVYDISVNHPDGQGNPTPYADLAAALGTDGANIPADIRRGGMSIKFIQGNAQSSDNKYVQYRLMSSDWSIDTNNWAICSDTILIENPEFIKVYTDTEDKILWAIKADGSIYFGAGVPPQVVDYIQQKIEELSLDEYEDIVVFLNRLEKGDKTLRELLNEKLDAEGLDASALGVIKNIENSEWIKVLTDAQDRIIAGVRKDGSVYISELDDETKEMIKSLIDISETTPIVINIPLLDANFTSPVPVTITGTKGTENAKYEFELPLSEDAFNIRFKFKITENILNQNKNAVIAKLGNANAVYATVTTLSQLRSSTTYNGETKIMNWPSLRGGIGLNGSSVTRITSSIGDKQNIGNFAFYIKYVGESTNVTIENTGQAFVVKVDGVETSLSYSTYPTVAELYKAIKLLPDFEVSYNELESRICSELAIFTECSLVGKYYTGINGTKDDEKEEYYDSAPFLIPYAVSEEWHQVEIVKIGSNIYASCDGTVVSISPTDNILVLGGNCGCLFKDVSIDTLSSNDAEVVNGIIISSVNPHIIIHEGHNIIKTPTCEIVDTSGNAGTTVDRLQLVYSKMISKGYVPVTLDEIADYYAENRTLPKRCFTSIFDDYRWVNCLDLDNRAVFTRLGILPSLAIITSYVPSTIVHNGSEITIQQASTICRNYRFGLVSHTRNHRDNWNIKPSTYISEFTADVYDGDIKGIDNSIIVYPFGHASAYLLDILKWLGFRLGVDIIRGRSNIKNRNRYNLTREDISVNSDIDDVLGGII